jgi:ABC-type lipoprotein release transport system permease subunit
VAPVVIGVIAGLGATFALSRMMATVLFGINPREPLMIAGVTVGLIAAAFGATWIPARRAAALNPLSALRHE